MDFINVSIDPQGTMRWKYDEPTTSSSVWGFFTGGSSIGPLKAATALASDLDLLTKASSVANDVVGSVVSSETLRGAIGSLAPAAALSAIPIAMVNTAKMYSSAVQLVSDPSLSNTGRFAIDTVKAGKEGLEVACGFGVKEAKLPKNALSCVSDIHGLWGAVQERSKLDAAQPMVPQLAGYHQAYTNAVDAKIGKNISGLAFHGLSFITGFFALVISPYWSATLGTIYLVACIVATVYADQVKNIVEKNVFGVVAPQLNGQLIRSA